MYEIKKNSMTNYLFSDFPSEETVNPLRVFEFNRKKIKKGRVVYLIEREMRAKDNFALNFAVQKSKELNLPLKILHFKKSYDFKPKVEFLDRQISQAQRGFRASGFDVEIVEPYEQNVLKHLQTDTSILIIDFNPIADRNFLKTAGFKIYEVDAHNIIPARFLSDKQEYSAATIRRKIYHNIAPFLTEHGKNFRPETEADIVLKNFVDNKLQYYQEFKNNPQCDVTSGLSVYLNLGFISAQRVALEVLKSEASTENKEAFLEELIVRKELAENFCLYCKFFKGLECVPSWAKTTLKSHEHDFRQYIYSQSDFETAKTHDKLWNAAQTQLRTKGVIQGYLRMYWAKKILEWSISADEALKTAIYLNDKYAFDAPSPNGYVGILWSIGALHDRAFAERPVIGKIRPMTYDGIKSKFKIAEYVDKYSYQSLSFE